MTEIKVVEFSEFPKIARLSRACVITEKIDGTNASVFVPEDDGPILFGSRTRWIVPESDNYGFARWGTEHADELRLLGPGHHFGEWWGCGCQRNYGLLKGEKRWSLFNVSRWADQHSGGEPLDRQIYAPPCCYVVPVLYRGPFTTGAVENALAELSATGSYAAPGFMQPEGVVIWHEAARVLLKKTILRDEEPKGQARP